MSVEELLEGLIVVSRVRRHYSIRASELDQIVDLESMISQEAEALQEKIPGGIVI